MISSLKHSRAVIGILLVSGSFPALALEEQMMFVPWTSDDTTATTLQEARDADFDNDGIPNYYEVETLFTHPLDKNSAGGDSDGDGLADGWEMFHFGELGIADPAEALMPDELTNKEKADLGLNPNTDYSASSGAQSATFIYDLTGRLTDVTTPVGAGAYTPDEEGNLLNAQ